MGMTLFDLKDAVSRGTSKYPAAVTASAALTAVDMQDTGPVFYACLDVGTVSGTTPTLDVKLTECETSGGTYTDISGATFAQVTASNATEVIRVLNRDKRYVKGYATVAGTTPSFTFGLTFLSPKTSY